jgi:alkylation response protein AidB-like acyl-CoA dehydrogenase
MYFGLSEEQSFFKDNVRKYLEEHATIDNIKHIASGDKKNLSAEIHQGLLNLGINGLLIPEEFGGLGLDLLFAAVVSEALGGGVGPTPFIAPYVMAPTAIKHAGSKTQQENYLSKIATNEYRFGVGFSEFIGKRNDAGIIFSDNKLNGSAMFVLDVNNATHLLLADEKGQIFVVDAKSSNIEIVNLTTIDKTRQYSEVICKNLEAELLRKFFRLNRAQSIKQLMLAELCLRQILLAHHKL